jgi:acetylornithine/succinyldiaminopimelate/putrescine aminotransferase
VEAKGLYLQQQLATLVQHYPDVFIGVTGRGLMQGLQLAAWDGRDSYFLAHASSTGLSVPLVCGYLLEEHRILTAPTFNHNNILRIEPPLTIRQAEIDRLLEALSDAAWTLSTNNYNRFFRYILEMPTTIMPAESTTCF